MTANMHIGILKTDTVRPEWVPDFGEYPDMFKRLLLGVLQENAQMANLP